MKLGKLNQLIDDSNPLKGRWEITPNHEIRYRAENKKEEVSLKAPIVTAEPDALVVSVTERQEDQKIVTSLWRLTGKWGLDERNRIVFYVEREKGKSDELTFHGEWSVNKKYEIVYSYETTELKTKKKRLRTLAFGGYWDISEKNRLSYLLGGGSDSVFRVRGAFQTKSIYAKDGEIRYQAGAELSGRRKEKIIILFGKWKVSHDLRLSFEITYENGRKKSIFFGGEYAIDERLQVRVDLTTYHDKKIGLEVVFTKEVLMAEGQAFLRLRKTFEESRIEGGIRFKF